MAKIPLRAYLKEIENYIERGEIDQAVTHAKNILKSYPKHIDTYRLLGKAFLESQRYSEAADILQRVLSVLPDDFISQIGMSIIREDEGNLNAAIWHMERAYEVQPFNPVVQDELRRLYGRRDGVEPPKIRLTRGALVRMYARGELYPQAIAETRAALAEDPQRQDLLVLLARLYYLSDRKNDAAEVCSELLRKLPYCYEANRLLAEFLPTTNRAEEAQKFLQRIYALDPYAAFVSPNAPTSDQVPDQVVMVEQFTWEGAMEEAQAPDWTRNAGVEWQESEEEEVLPDWLNTLKPEAPSSQQAAPEAAVPEQAEEGAPEAEVLPPVESLPAAANLTPEASAEPELTADELIPDWMKDQGWTASERPADEIMASEEETLPGEIAPAELPEWVQSIAPQELNQPADETERTEWLDQILAQPGGTNGKEKTLPDWGTNAEPSSEVPPAAEPTGSELPDWLSQLADERPTGSSSEETRKPAEFEGLPDWSQLGEPSPAEPAPDSGETPDWLRTYALQTPEAGAPVEQAP